MIQNTSGSIKFAHRGRPTKLVRFYSQSFQVNQFPLTIKKDVLDFGYVISVLFRRATVFSLGLYCNGQD